MNHDELRAAIQEAIRQQRGTEEIVDADGLLRQIEQTFPQEAGSQNIPVTKEMIAALVAQESRELDDYDDNNIDESSDANARFEDGDLSELGAETPSPYGGHLGHARESRFGGARPAKLGPYGTLGEQVLLREAAKKQDQLGDRTDLADQEFANLASAREVPGEDDEDVGRT